MTDKKQKGMTLFIPADCLPLVLPIIKASHERRKAESLNKALAFQVKNQARIDKLLGTSTQDVATNHPQTMSETTQRSEFVLEETPETPVTGYKQAVLFDAPKYRPYDESKPFDIQIAELMGYTTNSGKLVSELKKQTMAKLGIESKRITNDDKRAIYSYLLQTLQPQKTG